MPWKLAKLKICNQNVAELKSSLAELENQKPQSLKYRENVILSS